MRRFIPAYGAIILLTFVLSAACPPSFARAGEGEAAVRASADASSSRYAKARPGAPAADGTLLASAQFEPLLLFLLGSLLLSIATGMRWLMPRRPKANAKPFRTDSA